MFRSNKLFATVLTVLFLGLTIAVPAFAQSVTLEVDPEDTAAEGQEVTLTAEVDGALAGVDLEYRFAYRKAGAGNKIYFPQTGPSNSWSIEVPDGAAGNWDLGVQVRQAGTSGWSSPPVHYIVSGYVINEEPVDPDPDPEDLEVVEVVAIDNRTVEVTATPVPDDVTVNADDFRAFVNGASRVITSYTNVDTTTHHLQLATPVFAVGDVIRIDGRQDVGGSAEYTVPAQTDVVEVGDLDEMLFPVGTSELVVLENLPTSVQVRLQDGTVRNLGIENWSSATYSATQEGTYLFTGDLVLVHNVTNTQNLQAEIEVTVTDAVFRGIVTDISQITMEFNNNPDETFQVSSTATDILNYLGDPATRTAFRNTNPTATVFLDENDRIIRLTDITLGAGVTGVVDFNGFVTANAPANMVVRGRDGGTVNLTAAAEVFGDRLTLRNLNFTGANPFHLNSNNVTLLDSNIPGNLTVSQDGNTIDSVDVGGNLLIGRWDNVSGLEVINTNVGVNLNLAHSFATENIDITGGSVRGVQVVAGGAIATDVTIDGTAIGRSTSEPVNLLLGNTVGLTVMNTGIWGLVNDHLSNASDFTMDNVTVANTGGTANFGNDAADVMDISNSIFTGLVTLGATSATEDAVFTGCEFRGNPNSIIVTAAPRGTVFEDCTFVVGNNVADSVVNLAAITNAVTFRGTTTATSNTNAVVDIQASNGTRLVRLEGTIEGNESLWITDNAPDTSFNFTANVAVNDATFTQDTTVNGNNVLLNNVTGVNNQTVTLAGNGISVDSSQFAGVLAVNGRSAVFNATEFETDTNPSAIIIAVGATGVVFNNTVIESNLGGTPYPVTSNAPDTIFNNTTFRVPADDINVTGPNPGNPGTLTFNEFRYVGPNNVNTTANSGVVWNP